MSIIELISIIIGSIASSSVLTAWITAKTLKKTHNADAADKVADSAQQLVETMRVDLLAMKEELRTYRLENLSLQKRVFELEAELKIYKALHASLPVNLIQS